MVQLKISSGRMAGETCAVGRFPFSIGRSPAADLHLEDAGVWDQHLQLDFDPAQGFVLSAQPDTLANVNGWPIQAVILRNGDEIEIGAAKIRFWLGETKQSRLRIHGALVWLALLLVTAAQAGLIWWLLK